LLIAAINDNSDKPVKTIYFQEALIMNLRWKRGHRFHPFPSFRSIPTPNPIAYF
jgi:hypothetical protein